MNFNELKSFILDNNELMNFVNEYFENFEIKRYSNFSQPFFAFASGSIKGTTNEITLINFRKDFNEDEILSDSFFQLFMNLILFNLNLFIKKSEFKETIKIFSVPRNDEFLSIKFLASSYSSFQEDRTSELVFSQSTSIKFSLNREFSFYNNFFLDELIKFTKKLSLLNESVF